MSNNSFFITLESNADKQNHPKNSPNSFKITLQTPIDLRGEWETGLAQLIFPHSWHEKIMEQPDDDHHHHLFLIKLHVKGDAGNDMTKEAYWRDLHLVPRNYHTVKDILLAIWNACEQSKNGVVQFIYRAIGGLGIGQAADTNHVRINCTTDSFLALPIELAKIIGFDTAKMERDHWTQVGGISIEKFPTTGETKWCVISTAPKYTGRQMIPSPLNEHILIKLIDAERDMGFFQNIYINSDLIETQFVGATRANVLRVIAPQKEKGQVETFSFTPIFYVPLRVVKFNSVEINITGDTGRLVPFEGGVVVVVLHLRRKHTIIV